MERYTLNTLNDARTIDSNTVILKTVKGHFHLKGDNISGAINEILSCFKMPTSYDEVILMLQKKYSVDSLQKILLFLIEEQILIDQEYYETLMKYEKNFLDKTFYYTIGGNTLNEIIDRLKNVSIGILGTNQLVNCLLTELTNGGFINNFNVGVTENNVSDYKGVYKNTKITHYFNLTEIQTMDSFVSKSDFILVASNFNDHYLFNQVNELCMKKRKKWLRILIEGNKSEVGPLFIPNETSCYSCLRFREIANMSQDRYKIDLLYEDRKTHLESRDKSVGLHSMYHLNSFSCAIACSEMMKVLTNLTSSLLNYVMRINGDKLDIQKDKIFENRLCPVCSERL